MKKHQYEMILAALRSSIALLDGEHITPLERLKQTLLLTSEKINEIKKEVVQNGFSSTDEEIHFFKFVKPAFYALQIYEVDIYNLTTNVPPGTSEMQKAFYEQELLYLFRLFRTNAFHYQYFRSGARELDAQYFTREGRPGDIPVLELADPFPGFSTPLDYLFAKFIAAERLQHVLIDKLTVLYGHGPGKSAKSVPKLKWTGDTINLVEIAYGIWLTNQINDGRASMAEITRWLEEIFEVHIGDPNRRWQDIARRKSISPTKYLDLTISEIAKRIDNERSLNRQKRRSIKS
ncbi:MAG TPA: RteC domain-containing protein [Mucilaginibacter sp.]|nr:RteC domain-containing protein [Mucilaginibacter sp.]